MIKKIFLVAYLSLNLACALATKVFTDSQEEKFVETYSSKYKIPDSFIEKALEQAIFQPKSYQLQQPRVTRAPSWQSWEHYRRQFIYPAMINKGAQFMCTHQDALRRAR